MTPFSISVIIPTYNARHYIRDTLESVSQQTLAPLEIIIVDDRSTDNTLQIVSEIALHSSVPIKSILLEKNSGGPAHPINVGIAASKGEWIALLDHDDIMLPDKLETQSDCLRAIPEIQMCFSDYVLFGEEGTKQGIKDTERELLFSYANKHQTYFQCNSQPVVLHQLLYNELIMSCSNLLFKRSLWEAAGPFDLTHSPIADYLFKLKATAQFPIGFIPRVLFKKRVHSENLYDKAASFELHQSVWEAGLNALGSIGRIDPKYRPLLLRLRSELLDMGWNSQEHFQLRRAIRYYWSHARYTGIDARLSLRIIKTPIALLKSMFRTASSTHPKK